MKKLILMMLIMLCVSCSSSTGSIQDTHASVVKSSKLKVLIVDGQNNHKVWPKSTVMMKQYLQDSGLFEVDVYRTKPTWKGEQHPDYLALHADNSNFNVKKPVQDLDFQPNFNDYDVVVSNFGWKAALWPQGTQIAFENFIQNGGGLVTVHAANNAFPEWPAYNAMIGVGGWGGRDEKDGPYLYYDDQGHLVRETKAGKSGTHGKIHDLQITQRAEHPILRGLPKVWMHSKDECYGRLRGPAKLLSILATALCPIDQKGTGNHEPVLMTIEYGKGRIFHTTLGHEDYSFESVGFITTFLRGAEWAASGQVTQTVPADFPNANQSVKREFVLSQGDK